MVHGEELNARVYRLGGDLCIAETSYTELLGTRRRTLEV